jgi:hypothetical protein
LASLITKGSITGSANIKLTLPANQWYYTSSAINGATLGNFSTGSVGAKVYVYRNNQWYSTGAANVNTATLKLEGVLIKYEQVDPKLLDYTGVPNTGTIERTYSAGGWYLFGNPYPSFINWQEDAGWSRSNIDGTMWYRTSQAGIMTFITYNRNAVPGARVALYPEGTTWGNETEMANIPPMQAVWVKAYAATTITLDNGARNHSVTGSKLKSSSTGNASNVIRITSANNSSRDGAVIYFSSQSAEELDKGDSEKRFNDSELVPEIYTRIGNTATAINGGTQLDETSRTIPLSVRNKVADDVTLAFNLAMFSADYSVKLEDKLTGDMVDLKSSPDYTYTPAAVGDVHDRFVLHINYEPIQVVIPDEDESDGGTTEVDPETGNTDDGTTTEDNTDDGTTGVDPGTDNSNDGTTGENTSTDNTDDGTTGVDTGTDNTDDGTTTGDNTDEVVDNTGSEGGENPAETDGSQVSTSVVNAKSNGITIVGMRGRAVVTVNSDLLDYGDATIEIYTLDGQKVNETTSGAGTTLVTLPRSETVFIVKVSASNVVKIERVTGKL